MRRPLAITALTGALILPCQAHAHPGAPHEWAEATRAMAEDPFAVQPRLSRASVARREGRRLTAYFEARWARALAPHDAAPHRALGLAALDLGWRAEGLAALSAFFAAGGEDLEARVARARIRWAEHQPEAALEDLDRALALTPDPTAALLRAEWQRAQGRLPEAAVGLADVLTRAQGALPVRRALVEAYLDLKQPELALALLDAAPLEDPTWKALRARAAAR